MDFKRRTIIYEHKLSNLEDEISMYILKNLAEVSQMKITSLAAEFYTVPNTISRLCHKLGYSGFLEMKNALKIELSQESTMDSRQEIFIQNFDLLKRIRSIEAVESFRAAKKINVFAVGSTAYAARIIVDNFNALDYKFVFYEYEHEVSQKIRMADNEVFLFISLTGENEPFLTLAEFAREKSQKLITLTHLSENPLSKLADISLFCYSPKRIVNNSNITDKVPLLIIMDDLFYKYKEKYGI